MKGFIEVHLKYADRTKTRLVNIQHIVVVEEYLTERTEIYLTLGESSVITDLSYAEVKRLIEEAQK